MAVTAVSILSQTVDLFREMIADSQMWRAVVASPNTDWATLYALYQAASSSESDAKARIVKGVAEDDEDHADYVARPRCIVRHLDQFEMQELTEAGYSVGGQLIATFELDIPTTYQNSYADSYVNFTNVFGLIMENLKALPKEAGYLDLKSLSMLGFGQSIDDEGTQQEYWCGELLVSFDGGL